MLSLPTLKMGMMVVVVEWEGRDDEDEGEGEGFFFFFFLIYFIFKTGLMPKILVYKLSYGTILLMRRPLGIVDEAFQED